MREKIRRFLAAVLAIMMMVSIMPVNAFAAEADETLQASLAEAKSYIDGITINNSSNDPATVVKTFKKHFTWDNEKRENSKSYLFDWSYYNGVVFEGLEYIYEVTGESVYRDYVLEYMSSMITSSGGWANCTNSGYTSKQAAGYNSTHGADCYKTASLLMDAYEMSGDSRYLTMAKTLYTDLDNAAKSYSLSKAGNNFRHTWASDPSPDLWLDGLYMILPFRAEYAKHIGDTEELDLIVSRMQWVSDNMYNSSRKLFYHAADSASSNSGTYWLRSIGWYAAAIVDIMDSMSGANLEAMKAQLVKLVDGMKACQNASNGMWLNNMAASQSSSNPYETSGTALVCYAVMKAINNGWLDKSYADMAILAFNGICNEKLSGNNLTDICFKGAPGSSNSTFYDNEGKGLGPFIMFYAEVLDYVNNNRCDHTYETVTTEATCVKAGSVVSTCTQCGDSYTEEIPATGIHNYESVTVDATETTDGSITYTCSGCKDSYVEVIPATGDTTYSLDIQTGTVPQNAQASASVGAQVVITAPTGKQTYADVTLGMVSSNGNAVNTATAGTLTGLTVTYEGMVVSTEFTLTIEPAWIAMPEEDKGEAVITQNVGSVSSGSYYLLRNRTAGKYLTGTATGNRLNFGTANTDYWYVTQASGNTYYIQYGGPDGQYLTIGSDTAKLTGTATAITLSYVNTDNAYFWDIQQGDQHLNNYRKEANYASGWTGAASGDDGSCWYLDQVSFGNTIGGYARLMGETNQFYVTANAVAESDVLSKVTIQTSADGISTDSTQVPVTASMISWDKTFSGTSAGTYVGTVSYEGNVLGTVTVTVTLEHSYETVTVEATCTEAGSITTTCTVCGDSTVEVIEALGHTYACVETAATCGKDGSKVYTCAACGDTYTEVIPATGNHSYASEREEATCVTDGTITYTCTVCGDSYAETIPATGKHIYKSETVDATCVTDGSVTYTCAFCGDSYVEKIDAIGHNYTCTVTGATCTEEGSSVYTCSVCGDSYTEVIEALGHNYSGVVTGATCLEGGFTTYTCVNCGDSYVDDYTEALGHSYETAVVEATCTVDGSKTYYCPSCGDSYTETIAATGHTYQSVVTAPTCSEDGYTTHTCTKCGDSYVADEVKALGHSYETVTVAPTCTAGGYTTSTCAKCGDSYIDAQTEALGHDYVSVTVEPTETEGGYTTHTCSACGHSYTDNYMDALGHTIVSVVTEPTCESEGYTTHTCTVCGEVTVDNYVPALGHNYQTVTVEATCTTDGSVSGTCTNCGDSYKEVTAAFGHTYQTTVTAPTCTEGGHTVYSCDRCGDNYVADHTEALGHNYSEIVTDVTCTQDGYTTYLCVGCGDSYIGETVAATGHNYERVTAEATCTQDGSVTYTCTGCGDSYAEEIPATGHNYEAVVTEPTCTANGYTTYTCVCGDSYIGDETLSLGHSYSSEEVDGNLIYTCDACGDTYTVTTGWIAMSGTYVLDTDGIETGEANKYIVVGSNKDYALTLSGSTIGASAVTVSDNAITLNDASKYEFYFVDNSSKESGSYLLTQNGTKGVYHMGGDMYYGTDNKGYWHIGTSSNGAYQLYDYDNLNWYLNYGYVWASDSVSRFAVSSNARSVRLFKAVDSYVRLYGSLNQAWAHGADVTESAILNKVQIQTSMDGVTVDGSEAVTASMITWDKPLDGYTAGTYTATVTYNGEELGTITVIVTGEHAYEAVTTEATCTESGSTVYTCADCGYSYTDNYVEALGHDYATAESNGYLVYTCSRCGDSYSEKLGSTYTKVTAFSTGKNHVITLVSGSKYYALSHANNTISAVQMTVSNNEITSEITEDLLWTYSGNKLSYQSGSTTYYLYAQSNNWWGGWWGGWGSTPTLTISSSNSTSVSLSSNKVKMSNYYLKYSSGSVSLGSSGTTANLFVEE